MGAKTKGPEKQDYRPRVARIRAELGLNYTELAESLDVHHGTPAKWESEDKPRQPSPDALAAIVTRLGINPLWLLTGEGQMMGVVDDETATRALKEIEGIAANALRGRSVASPEDALADDAEASGVPRPAPNNNRRRHGST